MDALNKKNVDYLYDNMSITNKKAIRELIIFAIVAPLFFIILARFMFVEKSEFYYIFISSVPIIFVIPGIITYFTNRTIINTHELLVIDDSKSKSFTMVTIMRLDLLRLKSEAIALFFYFAASITILILAINNCQDNSMQLRLFYGMLASFIGAGIVIIPRVILELIKKQRVINSLLIELTSLVDKESNA